MPPSYTDLQSNMPPLINILYSFYLFLEIFNILNILFLAIFGDFFKSFDFFFERLRLGAGALKLKSILKTERMARLGLRLKFF